MRIKILLVMLAFSFLTYHCKKDNIDSKIAVDIYYQSFVIDYSKIKNDTSYYDINNDKVADIVAVRHTDTLPNDELRCSGKIYSLKDTMMFTFMRIKPNTAMLDTLDIINNSSNFSWIDTIRYSGNMWQGIFTPNFGFQHKNNGINYGWFHFDTGLLSEIAYNKIQNSSIRMKQKK
jgi:hypothetical protein